MNHHREVSRGGKPSNGAKGAKIIALREYRQALITAAVTGKIDIAASNARIDREIEAMEGPT